jgi:hypothetical protein
MVHDNNNLSPREKEAAKTKKERGEDIAYTLNNALVCTATDMVMGSPYLGHYIQKRLGNESQASKWYLAEVAGDFGAIPLTVGMQRYFPGTMEHISHSVEPLFKNFIRKGAQRATKEWAQKHGVSEDSEAYRKHFNKMYKYEVSHVPQALVWATTSTALNVGIQLAIDKGQTPFHHILAGKIGGAVFAAGITLGMRTLFPQKAEKLDHFISEKLVMPAHDREEKLEKLAGRHKDLKYGKKSDNWSLRVRAGEAGKAQDIRI